MPCNYWAFGPGHDALEAGHAPCGTCERCVNVGSGAVRSRAVHHQIDKAGLMPPGCKLIDIVIDVTGAVIMKYERFLEADEIEQLGIALQTAVEDIKR